MAQINDRAIAVTLGVAFAWTSIWIAGIGASITIPISVLKPLTQISGVLATVLVDLFTIALPLAAAFMVMAIASKWLIKRPDTSCYVLLLLPWGLLELYYLVQFYYSVPLLSSAQAQSVFLTSATVLLQRFLLLAGCFYLLLQSKKSTQARA